MVHITRQERNTILYTLLMDGVITCKKEFDGVHPETKVDNLKVWMLTRTLRSKGYVEDVFNWRHLYFSLNEEGVRYIKGILGINEAKVQPKTRMVRAEQPEPAPERRPRREFDRKDGERRERPERTERPEGGFRGERGRGARGAGRGFRGDREGFRAGRGRGGDRPRPQEGAEQGEAHNAETQQTEAQE